VSEQYIDFVMHGATIKVIIHTYSSCLIYCFCISKYVKWRH